MTGNQDKNDVDKSIFTEPEAEDEQQLRQIDQIIKDHDMDEFLNLLKKTRKGNTNEVLDLSSTFIERHLDGMDMFLELAVKLEPENAIHHYNRAIFLENQKEYDTAMAEYKTAIELDSENDNYYTELGNLLLILNKYSDAEEQYLEALQINPENADVWTNLGILYYNKKEPEKAENALKKAISLEPNSTLPYLNLIKLYKGKGKISEAKNIVKKYKELKLSNLNINVMHLDK